MHVPYFGALIYYYSLSFLYYSCICACLSGNFNWTLNV